MQVPPIYLAKNSAKIKGKKKYHRKKKGAILFLPDCLQFIFHLAIFFPQVPPNYSALKIKGERAYDLARCGVDFELKPRPVTVCTKKKKMKREKNQSAGAHVSSPRPH